MAMRLGQMEEMLWSAKNKRKMQVPFGTPGFGGVPAMGSMTSTPASADDRTAFNEGRKNRALLGKFNYGSGQYEGGIERDVQKDANAVKDRETAGKYRPADPFMKDPGGTEVINANAKMREAFRPPAPPDPKYQVIPGDPTMGTPDRSFKNGVPMATQSGGASSVPANQQGLDFTNPQVRKMIEAQGGNPDDPAHQAMAAKKFASMSPQERSAMGGQSAGPSRDIEKDTSKPPEYATATSEQQAEYDRLTAAKRGAVSDPRAMPAQAGSPTSPPYAPVVRGKGFGGGFGGGSQNSSAPESKDIDLDKYIQKKGKKRYPYGDPRRSGFGM